MGSKDEEGMGKSESPDQIASSDLGLQTVMATSEGPNQGLSLFKKNSCSTQLSMKF